MRIANKGLAAALIFWLLAAYPAAAEGPCHPVQFDTVSYTVCTVDPAHTQLALYNADATGAPYGSFGTLAAALQARGQTLLFAMNAGMFDDKLRPIGLYVEQGRELKKINRRGGPGNFHMKPNGVFYFAGGRAGVLETEAYLKARPKPDFATQSGPMLVINGAIHPAFSPTGTSYKRRNGVGIRDDGQVVFAISEVPVNFYGFARLFRDELGTKNALFFDGTVSSLYDLALARDDQAFSLGPIVAAVQ
ncbi:phosphodiester glycosidase family protein [soil metagenome]